MTGQPDPLALLLPYLRDLPPCGRKAECECGLDAALAAARNAIADLIAENERLRASTQ